MTHYKRIKSIRKIGLIVLLTMVISSQVFAVSLEQSVASAIDSNPRIMRQYAKFRAAASDSDAAEGVYWPSLDVKAGYGYEDIQYKTGNELDYFTKEKTVRAITVSQLLFNGMGNVAEAARLDHEAEAERLLLIGDAENLALEVTEQYIALSQAKQFVLLAERNLQQHQQIYDEIQKRVNKGVSSQSDMAQVTSRLSSSQSALLVTRRNFIDLKTRFTLLVSLQPRQLITPKIDEKLIPSNLEEVIQLSQKNNPEIRSALQDIQAMQQENRASKSGYWPTLTIDAELYDNDNIGGVDGEDSGSNIMLNMRYNLFNGMTTTNKAKASGWRYEEAYAIKDQAGLKVIEQARLAWTAMQLLRQQELILQTNVDAAILTDSGYSKQFEIGRRTLLDVLDAKIEVYRARQNYLNTRYDRFISEFRLLNAMGLLLYSLRVDVPEQWKAQPQ